MVRTLYDLFAASVARHGDEVAIEVGEDRLTYRELSDLADGLAAAVLAEHRTAPRRIGLLAAGRTLFAYAGYLAVQRLGATVVPLNAAFPVARNAAVAAAAGLDLVLVEDGMEVELPAPMLYRSPRSAPAAALPPYRGNADDIAYILFTSGSTGVPKGVPIRHGNVTAYLGHVVPRYDIGPGSRVSQTFDLTFDLSVFDLFATWAGGGTLVVPNRAELMAPSRYVAGRELTHWFSVPSAVSFARRLRALPPDSMPTLRWSLFCGEQLTRNQAEAWRAAAVNGELENLYGPTELTISCAEYRLPRNVADWPHTANGTIPIGNLYPGQEQLLIGPDGPSDTAGELCVRGPQRFPGYLNAVDNVGRFVRWDGGEVVVLDETTPLTDDLWYRTGDWVVADHGGLVHQGRVDQQIKIRGFRIELGEVEAVLLAQPGVRDALVLAVSEGADEPRLAAVCTGVGLAPDVLLTALRTRLPAYMVPAEVVIQDDFPRNANGKVDRKAILRELVSPA
ncbi:AMP-binding protein [Kutzneria sp. CA-103260]|uniref:AMP-binding protein n=1 Tax=Kutzneria sp. CA-103260 TaxID=2802641 RepID=UPI001BABD9FB|nr:AMP-binding protein [Kutzneria sp. CA-103260]QUQ67055.1 D-alanine--poly(phosphoribitol) ligase [Kutzneria sp. CA-103260]